MRQLVAGLKARLLGKVGEHGERACGTDREAEKRRLSAVSGLYLLTGMAIATVSPALRDYLRRQLRREGESHKRSMMKRYFTLGNSCLQS